MTTPQTTTLKTSKMTPLEQQAIEEFEKEFYGFNERGIVAYWENLKQAQCQNCGLITYGDKAKDMMFGHKECPKPNGRYQKNPNFDDIKAFLLKWMRKARDGIKDKEIIFKISYVYYEINKKILLNKGYIILEEDSEKVVLGLPDETERKG